MPNSQMMAVNALDFGGIRDSVGTPLSDWLRTAILESVRREPLLAAEDAIMLADIVIALSRETLTVSKVLSNPIIGGWLKQAVTDSLRRPFEEVRRDTEFLRDVLIVNLFSCYRDGQLCSPDDDIRICNIIDMVWGVGKEVMLQWSHNAIAHLKIISEAADGGLTEFQDCADSEYARGHHEIAEIFEQMSCFTADELRNQLSMISEGLSAAKSQLQ
jgi:hypothetical protein